MEKKNTSHKTTLSPLDVISSDEPELTDAPGFNTTAVLVRMCYHFVRNSSTKKGCSCLKHACPRWRQHLAVEPVCLKAWSAVPTTQLFLCWNSQTESFKSCSIHDPSTLDENILLQITFFFFFENTCHISANCIVSICQSSHARAADAGLRTNWVQTSVLTREQTFYGFCEVEEKINLLPSVYFNLS